MLPRSTEVLIVGAGPTGLALAVALRQAGVDHVVVDRLSLGQTTSRAAVIHAQTLETLERIGVADELVQRGMPLSRFSIRDGVRALMQLTFDDLPSRYTYILMIPQDETERVLAGHLEALRGVVHRGVTATEMTRDGSGAQVHLDTPDGEWVVSARHVVGGDGLNSRVRGAAGIEFDGAPDAESFVLADVRMKWGLGQSEVSLFLAEAGMVVVAPLPNGGFRLVATLEDAPVTPGVEHIQAILDERGPTNTRTLITEVLWSSRFRVQHRLARTYRSGPFLLMGDAAHVHSPAGGQGMNTGLVDAVVLGEILAAVAHGAPADQLDNYEALRRPAAQQVLRLAGNLTSIATVHGTPKRLARNAVLRIADHVPAIRNRMELGLSGIARRQNACVTTSQSREVVRWG